MRTPRASSPVRASDRTYYDVSAFTGRWPFHQIRRGGLGHRLADSIALGVGGGLISSLEAIFYNDPWEADRVLTQSLPKHGRWQAVLSLNPLLPHAPLELARHGRLAGAVRLYPGIHGYEPDIPESVELCRQAGELGQPVQITGRLEDPRLEYILRQTPVDIRRAAALADRCPNTRFLLSNFYQSELSDLNPVPENLWSDTVGLCHELFPLENLRFPAERLVFGSCAPLLCLESAFHNISESARPAIMTENPRRFLSLGGEALS